MNNTKTTKVTTSDILRATTALQVSVYEQTGGFYTQMTDEQNENNLLMCAKTCYDLAKQYVKQERD